MIVGVLKVSYDFIAVVHLAASILVIATAVVDDEILNVVVKQSVRGDGVIHPVLDLPRDDRNDGDVNDLIAVIDGLTNIEVAGARYDCHSKG